MSLKAFHVFFISVATIFTVSFGVWGVRSWLQTGSGMDLAMAIGSLAGSIALIWYFKWFLKKLKNVSYL